jgi:hypothetical protein
MKTYNRFFENVEIHRCLHTPNNVQSHTDLKKQATRNDSRQTTLKAQYGTQEQYCGTNLLGSKSYHVHHCRVMP